MSRCQYHDDYDQWDLIRWRGAVASAIKGKRGQAFLREMLKALDAMPEKALEKELLVAVEEFKGQTYTECCAMGAVAVARGQVDEAKDLDPFEFEDVAHFFNIAAAMAREISFQNDDVGPIKETPEQRWTRMRAWVVAHLKADEGVVNAIKANLDPGIKDVELRPGAISGS